MRTGYGGYSLQESIKTNISAEYLDGESSWDQWAALRECLQNVADEADYMARQDWAKEIADFCKISIRSGWIVLQDYGRGCNFEDILLLGKSGKRGHDYRGEKGEGQLMAFLVFTKLEIPVQMFSQDWLVIPRFGAYNGSENQVLVLDVYKASNPDGKRSLKLGTVIKIQETDNLRYYIRNLGDYFPDLSKRAKRRQAREQQERYARYDKEDRKAERQANAETKRKSTTSKKTIFAPRKGTVARLYLKGIYVRDLTSESGLPALFSYNLWDVSINRDRSMVDQAGLKTEVAQKLASDEVTRAMMDKYWQNADGTSPLTQALEYQVNLTPTSEIQRKWLLSFRRVYGKQTCIYTNPYASSDSRSEGWTVIDLLPNAKALARLVGVLTDRQAAGFADGDFKTVKPTKRETQILALCTDLCNNIGVAMTGIRITSKVLGQPSLLGFYKDNTTYILRSVLDKGGIETLEVVLHELAHHNTGETDFTRRFTGYFLNGWLLAMMADPAEYIRNAGILQKLSEIGAV